MTGVDRQALLQRLQRSGVERQERLERLARLRTEAEEPSSTADFGGHSPSGHEAGLADPPAADQAGDSDDGRSDLREVLARRRRRTDPSVVLRKLRDESCAGPGPDDDSDESLQPDDESDDSVEVSDEFAWRNRFSGPIPDHKQQSELARAIEAGVLARAALGADRHLETIGTALELQTLADEGQQAFDLMVTGNLRLVIHWAFRSSPDLDVEDKFQYGIFGLRRAVERWDWRRGYTFATYASYHIRQAIARGVDNDAYAIRLPVHVHEALRLHPDGRQDEGSEPSGSAALSQALRITEGILSLEEVGQELEATVDDDDFRCWDPGGWLVDRLAFEEAVQGALETLDPRSRDVMEARSGMYQEPLTLDQIGKSEGVTRERIRQIEAKAEGRLRARLWTLMESWDSERALFKAAQEVDPRVVSLLRSPEGRRRLDGLAEVMGVTRESLESTFRQLLAAAR